MHRERLVVLVGCLIVAGLAVLSMLAASGRRPPVAARPGAVAVVVEVCPAPAAGTTTGP